MIGNDPDGGAGPLFLVDSVGEFYEQNRAALSFRYEPRDIPPGLYTVFDDPAGNIIRVMDVSKESGDRTYKERCPAPGLHRLTRSLEKPKVGCLEVGQLHGAGFSQR